MTSKDLLYRKLNALRLEVDGSIVDDIKETLDQVFAEEIRQRFLKKQVFSVVDFSFTILCLTVLSLADFIFKGEGVTLFLWFGYGLYKFVKD